MKYYMIDSGNCGLKLHEGSVPDCPAGHVCIKTSYMGINRADLLQVQDRYPRPDSGVPGLEVSGIIEKAGENVMEWQVGDRVCALLTEGGYAAYVIADARHILPVPPAMTDAQAAAYPEALATAWYGLHDLAHLEKGETVLIHGGSSGIGTIAIQLALFLGCRVLATAGDQEKCDLCKGLGAEVISYPDYDPAELAGIVKSLTQGKGVNVVLDILGGEYITANLKMLAYQGRLVSIACMSGAEVTFNMAGILMKNLSWHGMTLRSQSASVKARIIEDIRRYVWPACEQGIIVPHIYGVYPFTEAHAAHQIMQARKHSGKLLLAL